MKQVRLLYGTRCTGVTLRVKFRALGYSGEPLEAERADIVYSAGSVRRQHTPPTTW